MTLRRHNLQDKDAAVLEIKMPSSLFSQPSLAFLDFSLDRTHYKCTK